MTPAGRGVFARRLFRRNQVVGQMTGRVTKLDDYDPSYVVDLGKSGVLEPFEPFRFLNHSCDPNCELQEWESEEAGADAQIWVQTLRTVREGDQLTIDYGWPADAAIPCLCGSAECRGWVVDADELPKLLRREARQAKARAKSTASTSRKKTSTRAR
jgi:uncharacterized protein